MKSILSLLCIFTILTISQTKNSSIWKHELQEEVKHIRPLMSGQYIFLQSDEYAWLYETRTGKKVWGVKIEEYIEKGMHQIVYDSLYIVSDEDSLKCFAMFQNRLLWKQRYPAIEQDEFRSIKHFDTLLILTFGSNDLCVTLSGGTEVWRKQVQYEKDLIEQGSQNAIMLERRNKYFAFLEDGSAALFDAGTGKRLLSLPQCVPNGDLIKQQRAWYYLPHHQKFIALVSEKDVALVDLKEDSLLARRPLSVDEQYNVIAPTTAGCGFFGEEKFLHINVETGKVSESVIDIGEIRNYVTTTTDSGEVMIISLENKLIGLNLDNGKMLWQTAPKYPHVNGFVHRFVASDTNNVIVTYIDPTDDLKLYVMSLNALTGKVLYRTLVAHSDESLPKRELPLKPISAAADNDHLSFGFEQAGFTYSITSNDSEVRVLIHTISDMIEPNTDTEGGEGMVIVDMESGGVIFKNYMQIAQGLSFKGGFEALAKPLALGSMVILPGNKNLVALDTETGTLRWMLIEQDLNGSYVLDAAMIDTILYARTGGSRTEYSYDAKKEKLQTKKIWEEDDYSLLAVDTSNGKVLWKKEFEFDPSPLFPAYSVSGYTVGDTLLLFGSEKFLYTLSLKKNALRWSFEFSDSGIGSYSYDELFRQSSYWEGEHMMAKDSLRYFTDSNFAYLPKDIAGEKYHSGISRVLQVNYAPSLNSLIALGEDGVTSINPLTGKRLWYYEWDYSDNSVQYRPMFIKNNLFYCINKMATLLNLSTGKIVWQTELDKETGVFIMPDCSSVLFIYKDEISGGAIP
ncbi:MAG: PQQ-binding-like beta-propeller repeat protein [Ignavibacteriales bacterium]|nr:PQQ-binding-like beta-propeller repeat protein [Ignavibacteriales bacterium]